MRHELAPRAELPFRVVCDSRERELWLSARRSYVGASETAAVLGESPWSSAIELWSVKTERAPEPDFTDNEAVFWGNALESAIIAGYAQRTGRATVPFGLLLASTRWPLLSATPDALTTDDPEAAKRALQITRCIGHIRTALKKRASTVALLDTLHDLCTGWWPLQTKNIGFGSAEHWIDGVPLYYRIQCAQEALVFGASRCTGAALIAGQRLAWDDIDVDPQNGLVERQIVNLTAAWWRDYVLAGVQPPVDASQSARRTLDALYPREKPETVRMLGAALMERAHDLDDRKAEVKALEGEIALIENEIKAEMGDAERVNFPDGSGFTWKARANGGRQFLRKKAKGDK